MAKKEHEVTEVMVEEYETISERIVRAQNMHAKKNEGITLSEYKKEQAEILGMVLRSNADPLK